MIVGVITLSYTTCVGLHTIHACGIFACALLFCFETRIAYYHITVMTVNTATVITASMIMKTNVIVIFTVTDITTKIS